MSLQRKSSLAAHSCLFRLPLAFLRWDSGVTCRGQGFRRWGRDRGLGGGGRPVVEEVGEGAVVQQVGGRGRN